MAEYTHWTAAARDQVWNIGGTFLWQPLCAVPLLKYLNWNCETTSGILSEGSSPDRCPDSRKTKVHSPCVGTLMQLGTGRQRGPLQEDPQAG